MKSRWYSKFLIAMALIILVWSGRGIQASAQGLGDPSRNQAGKNPQIQAGLAALPTDHIILKYKSTSTAFKSPAQAGQMDRLNAAAGTALSYLRSMSGDSIVLGLPERLPVDQVQKIVDQLMTLPEVEYAEPDFIRQHTLVPNDPQYSNQWHYFAPTAGNYGINAPAAWDITTGSASIVVAVIDTGITNHAEFAGRTVPGYDMIADELVANDGNGRDSDPSDPGDWITTAENASGYFFGCTVTNSSWHGTHTAGTIGAASNNGVGVAGINWNSKILPVRVLGKCGGYDSDIIDAMRWAAGLAVSGVPANANPAKVENISLGGAGACLTAYQNAVNAVNAAGTTIVVSAGNNDANASGYAPANCNGVITVAATDRYGDKAWYSNYGSTVEISAPGGDTSITTDGILSTLNTGTRGPAADTYVYYQGTSMAAPHVTGVVSLLYSLNPALTPSQALQIIQNTATTFPGGSTCNTSLCGSGILNAGAAVASTVNTLSVTKSGTGSGTVTSAPAGINCGSTCSAYFTTTTTVILTAAPDASSTFTGWSGACTGSGTCSVTMSAARSVTATFAPNFTNWYGGAVISSDHSVVAVGRPQIGNQVMTYDGFTGGSTTMYLPMLFKNMWGYDSAFYVQNLDAANPAAITLKFYDTLGNLSCTLTDSIPLLSSHGTWVPDLTCLPASWVGGVVVTSDRNIVAVGRPHIGSEITTYNGFSSGSLTMYVPMLFKNMWGYDAALYVQNVDAANTADITLKFYDTTGNLTCTQTDSIPRLSSHGYWLPDLTCLGTSWVGGVVVTSNRNIVAVGRPHLGAAVTTYDGFASGNSNFYVPSLFKNAAGSFDSALYVQNISPSNAANITLKYYDMSGSLTCTQTDSIPLLSSHGYWLPDQTCLGSSWQGSVKVESSQPVVAVGRPHMGGDVASFDGFTGGSTLVYVPMLFKNMWSVYNSALTVQNIDLGNTANITIDFYDVNGNLSCTRTDSIPALGTIGYWMPDLTCSP